MPLFLQCKYAEKDSSNQEYHFPIPPKTIYHQYYGVLSPSQVFRIETSLSKNHSSSRLQSLQHIIICLFCAFKPENRIAET